MRRLARAAADADRIHLTDPACRAELMEWTDRPAEAGDGIGPYEAVTATERRVPVRDFSYFSGGFSAGLEHDVGALYAVVFTDSDTTSDRLRAGAALSAVLLNATAAELGSEPISDVIEVPAVRARIGDMLEGGGFPQILVRVGHPPAGQPASSPRRPVSDVVNP